MNRVVFKQDLTDKLMYKIKPNELHQLLDYYDEMIDDLMEDGYSESDAINKVGSPNQIANDVSGKPEIELKVKKKYTPLIIVLLIVGFPLWGSIALAILMLILSGLILLLSFYVILWCIPFTTGLLGISVSLGGIISAIVSPLLMTDTLFMGVTQLGIGTLLFGVGILLLLLTFHISSFFIKVTQKSGKAIWSFLFKRKRGIHFEN